ncbi:MAG: Y-family DNA polymerase [Oscillospiraceae bacterium]|nr:Y-family DNA polymerase [Oscillospiraceae bacterium]
MEDRHYICIDLKSFYASVECVERGLDPMKAKLVVADPERKNGTICLAVSPALKSMGVKNRCRVFEIPKNIEYIKAPPRMQLYIDYSAEIYGIYLSFFSPEDIHVYSIDEAFIDVTNYLKLYKQTPRQLAKTVMGEILKKTGIRATCGIGTNLYLCKIALDILAKHTEDFIGELTEESFIKELWDHRPLTDFWRIGAGTSARLEKHGIRTMRQIAEADEDMLYREFGIDAELLIDHARGREITRISDIKRYKAKVNSFSNGQVLMRDYAFDEGRLIVKEMADLICQRLVKHGCVTNSLSLYVGYSHTLNAPSAKGSTSLSHATNSPKLILPALSALYNRITNPEYPVRRINICCNNVEKEGDIQLSLFYDLTEDEKEEELQKAILAIKRRYGKNAILKAMNFNDAATTRERNMQIGGHKSGEQNQT